MRVVFNDSGESTKYLIIGENYEIIAILDTYADCETFINYYEKRLTA